jgi:hypothetical protein
MVASALPANGFFICLADAGALWKAEFCALSPASMNKTVRKNAASHTSTVTFLFKLPSVLLSFGNAVPVEILG